MTFIEHEDTVKNAQKEFFGLLGHLEILDKSIFGPSKSHRANNPGSTIDIPN